MTHGFYTHIILPVIFLLMAVYYLAITVRAWRCRHPFLLSQRWQFGLMAVAFSPMIVNSFLMTRSFHSVPLSLQITAWISPAMLLVLLAYCYYQMGGYTVFAVTEQSFREGFLAAVEKLGSTCEERMSSIRILPQDVTFNVAVVARSGTGIIRANKDGSPLLKSLAREMNAHFAERGGETNQVTTLFYGVLGLFMIALAVSMFLLKIGR